jgi:choline dehydrogenase-like flavoprotein
LLASANNKYPNGLANSSDQVGRNMMVHPPAFVTGVFPFDLESYKGPVGNILYSHEFYETDKSRGFVRGFQLQAQRQYGGLDTALGGVVGVPVPWGENHHDEFNRRMGRLATLLVLADDLPEQQNRIILDENLADSDGIPAPKLIYSYSENTKRILDFGVQKATNLMKAAGAADVLIKPRVREVFHLMGTARMGNDPESSVVNKWGRSHDIPNLFIIDGSVFVTGGSANPTSTVQALALRFADYISRNRGEVLR